MTLKVNENNIECSVVLMLGLIMIASALSIADNPVTVVGWVDFFAEARFVPLMTAVVVTCLGIGMFFVNKGKQVDTELSFARMFKNPVLKRMMIIILITLGYILLMGRGIPFLVLTFFYLAISTFYITYGEVGLRKILLASLISAFAVAYLLPLVLDMTLP